MNAGKILDYVSVSCKYNQNQDCRKKENQQQENEMAFVFFKCKTVPWIGKYN